MLKTALKYLLGLAFATAGANHFVMTDFYLSMMPPYLPWHLLLVYLSGAIEFALGVALLVPRFTRVAAWGMIALCGYAAIRSTWARSFPMILRASSTS